MELIITQDVLPESYRNTIVLQNNEVTIIRSNINSMIDINEWMKIFQNNTNTRWIVRLTFPHKTRIVCGKRFICQHSSYRKSNIETSKRKKNGLKNINCPADIKFVVKLYNLNTKRTDPFVRDGLCGIIKIRNIHSHRLHCKEVLRCLQPDLEMKRQFYEYFELGMGISEACKFHESLLKDSGCNTDDLFNARKNPLYRTIRYWHAQWKNENTEIVELTTTDIKLDEVIAADVADVKEEILDENDVSASDIAERLRNMDSDQRIVAESLISQILSLGAANELPTVDAEYKIT